MKPRSQLDEGAPGAMRRCSSVIFAVLLVELLTGIPAWADFSFSVTSDQRNYTGAGVYNHRDYFLGVVLALRERGAGAFMISPGDIDPPEGTKWTIESLLGADYQWYPVVGNHELPGQGYESYRGQNLEWLRNYNYDLNGVNVPPDIVNPGPTGCPETTFSFDFDNAHFVILNEYCDMDGDSATKGDIPDHLFDWLENDLAATKQQHIFVFGHEPALPQPDADNGRERHMSDSLNAYPANRDRFWSLLKRNAVVAYFCGHTHNYSAVQIDGVWQLDSGHARGRADTGAPSTFLVVKVAGGKVHYSAYRDNHDGIYDYDDIVHTGVLKDSSVPASLAVPLLLLFAFLFYSFLFVRKRLH
ncbi:MAG: metallophosphoesterase [Desulforhabdus sp.]|jgi:hypothetical protein|nr:metallophosphoesterase [Desulforhabdus sp.]